MIYHFNTVRNDVDTGFVDKFVTFRRRVVWLVAHKDAQLNKLSKMLLAKAVMAQDETWPTDTQFGLFSVEGNIRKTSQYYSSFNNDHITLFSRNYVIK